MYRLLSPIHSGLGVLIQEVEDHIKEIGLSAVKSLKGENVSNGINKTIERMKILSESNIHGCVLYLVSLGRVCNANINHQ